MVVAWSPRYVDCCIDFTTRPLTYITGNNAAGSVVSTVTNAANTDTSDGAAVPTAAPVIAGGLLGAGLAIVAVL